MISTAVDELKMTVTSPICLILTVPNRPRDHVSYKVYGYGPHPIAPSLGGSSRLREQVNPLLIHRTGLLLTSLTCLPTSLCQWLISSKVSGRGVHIDQLRKMGRWLGVHATSTQRLPGRYLGSLTIRAPVKRTVIFGDLLYPRGS